MDITTLALAKKYAQQLISELTNGADEKFDTIKEISDWINNNEETFNIILNSVSIIESDETNSKIILDELTPNKPYFLKGTFFGATIKDHKIDINTVSLCILSSLKTGPEYHLTVYDLQSQKIDIYAIPHKGTIGMKFTFLLNSYMLENVNNKATSIQSYITSEQHYPTVKAVYDFVIQYISDAIANIESIPGEPGKSAYELAVDNGFEGNFEEWLDSLKGKDGNTCELNGIIIYSVYNADDVYALADVATSSLNRSIYKYVYICNKGENFSLTETGPITKTIETDKIYNINFMDNNQIFSIMPIEIEGAGTILEFQDKFGNPQFVVISHGKQGPQGPKGEPFTIAKTYSSIEEMDNDFTNEEVLPGSLVVIVSDVEDEDNAKLYIKGQEKYVFVVDMSGMQGIKGEQGPQGKQGEPGITTTITDKIKWEDICETTNNTGYDIPTSVFTGMSFHGYFDKMEAYICLPAGFTPNNQSASLNIHLSTNDALGPAAASFPITLSNKHTVIKVSIEKRGHYSIKATLAESTNSWQEAMSKPASWSGECAGWYANNAVITAPIGNFAFAITYDNGATNFVTPGAKVFLYGVKA